ncbi:MAG: hypothetical protein JW864_05915 [Spirochaetes bacterium]|nr:hypothetical protein [Spirochaetota bacterium]
MLIKRRIKFLTKNNRILRVSVLISFLFILMSCAGSSIKKKAELRFAVIANTCAESPYADISPRLEKTIESINRENPVFLVHMGGMVCGGSKWMGITDSDIKRQYNKAFKIFSKLSPILYTVKGKSDLLNTSSVYYEKFTERKSYYSFNYGNLHLIVLDSTERSGSIPAEQKKWLLGDLGKCKDSESIIVFIHSVLFVPEKYKSFEEERCSDYQLLHRYFKEFKVKAVFSGSLPFYLNHTVDEISYINTGCCGYNDGPVKNSFQYYVVDISNASFKIKPEYVGLY